MALSTGTVTISDSWYDGQRQHVVGTIAVGASALTYAPGGPVTTFAIAGVKSSLPPVNVEVHGQGGFIYAYIPGTTIANGTLKVFVEDTVGTNTPLAEHSTAAIVAGVSGDTIRFHAIFKVR